MKFCSKRVFLLSRLNCHGKVSRTLIKIHVMAAINFKFISNNVKSLKLTEKRVNLFEYFKSKLAPSGVLFAEETHSAKETEQKWNAELNGQIFFSHGKSNSCGLCIAFLAVNQQPLQRKFLITMVIY